MTAAATRWCLPARHRRPLPPPATRGYQRPGARQAVLGEVWADGRSSLAQLHALVRDELTVQGDFGMELGGGGGAVLSRYELRTMAEIFRPTGDHVLLRRAEDGWPALRCMCPPRGRVF